MDVRGGGSRHRAPLVPSLLEVKSRFGEFAYQPGAGVREITMDPAWVDRHIVSAEVPILGTVRCHEAIVHDLRGGTTTSSGSARRRAAAVADARP